MDEDALLIMTDDRGSFLVEDGIILSPDEFRVFDAAWFVTTGRHLEPTCFEKAKEEARRLLGG